MIDDAQSGVDAPNHIAQKLYASGYEIGRIVVEAKDMPLRQYLKNLIPSTSSNGAHFEKTLEAMASYLSHRGVADAQIDGVCDHLSRYPVIQQADHSNILLDEEVFLNNLLFSLASAEVGARMIISSQCSTVSCLSRRDPVAGPVFLRTRGALYKTFSLSKRALKDSNFCCLPSPITTSFELLEGEDSVIKNDSLIRSLSGRTFNSSSEAYWTINNEIWNGLSGKSILPRVALDETMTAELVALHILDQDSPISRLLFTPSIRESFVAAKRDFVSSSRNRTIKRSMPDFLWFKDKARLYPVVLDTNKDGSFFVDEKRIPFPMPFTPQNIAAALRRGDLYPDIILSYFARCLLPQVTAVGGTSQPEYVRHHRDIFLETHRQTPFLDDRDVHGLEHNSLSLLGGAPLLQLSKEGKEFISQIRVGTNVDNFCASFLDVSLGRTVGAFNCASYMIENMSKELPIRSDIPATSGSAFIPAIK